MKLNLTADRVKIYGPKVDGGFTLTFDIGEYEIEALSEVLKLQTDEVVKLTIEQSESKRDA